MTIQQTPDCLARILYSERNSSTVTGIDSKVAIYKHELERSLVRQYEYIQQRAQSTKKVVLEMFSRQSLCQGSFPPYYLFIEGELLPGPLEVLQHDGQLRELVLQQLALLAAPRSAHLHNQAAAHHRHSTTKDCKSEQKIIFLQTVFCVKHTGIVNQNPQ